MTRLGFGLVAIGMLAAYACADEPTAPQSARSESRPAQQLGVTSTLTSSSTTIEVVTEQDVVRQAENTAPTNDWVLYTRNAGTGDFVSGPQTPPLGVGSFHTVTPGPTDKVYLFNYDHVGTPLSAIDGMGYATYRTSPAVSPQLPSINLQVDLNGTALPGGFTTLVFEPIYNPTQGAPLTGQWQTWDAYAGGTAIWWSSQLLAPLCTGVCYVPWSAIVAAFPNAVVVGGFGVNQGSGNPLLDANTDALRFSDSGVGVTYDFEPYRTPQDKHHCKNGGWQTVRTADGQPFDNQGDCVSYVVSQRRS